MNWPTRWQRLRAVGILGMNERNARCILDLNPRRLFPQVDVKSRMHQLCHELGVPTPDTYGLLKAHSALRHLPRLLDNRAEFVLKPDRGAGGRGILVIIGREDSRFVRSNGEHLTMADLQQHASSIISGLYSLAGLPDAVLIEQRVDVDPVFERISYEGTPDVRVILYKQVPVMAMLRLPTKLSRGRANLHQGALGVGVDINTGITARGVLRNRLTDRHPDSGATIVGIRVPHWPRIVEMAVKISKAVGLGYVGVDILIDRSRGPLVLEANARPGLAIQIANEQGLIPRLNEIDNLQVRSAT